MVAALKANGKNIFEDAGVMPNPTVEKLNEGIERAKKAKADFILAVGSIFSALRVFAISERLDKGLIDFGIFIEPFDLSKYDYLRLPLTDTCKF